MKKRSKGVGRLLKARQNLKNIAKELGIPLEEVFNEAAALKKRHDQPDKYDLVKPYYDIAAGVAPTEEQQTRNLPVAGSSPAASPATSGRVREPGLSGDTRNVATVRSEGSNPSPSATTLYGEPVQIAQQQPRPGDHADGLRVAEPDPSTPDNAPYYADRCTACHEEMMTRSQKEDICATCAVFLRDETVDAIRSMESKATGQLINPFRDPFGEE